MAINNPGAGFRGWPKEKRQLEKFCRERGLELTEGTAAYQTAKIKADGVCIVVYPHKVSTGNRHLRVRNEHSKNEQAAYDIMCELKKISEYYCTFTLKGN